MEAMNMEACLIDNIWDQWNQTNNFSSSLDIPFDHKHRQKKEATASGFTEVYDAEFKFIYEVPSHLIVHTPSTRLNITRLVMCRNYTCGDKDSCQMRENCRFVHADVDVQTLGTLPVHVNYIWPHEDMCTYKRLPPGEVLEILSADMCTLTSIPSERILVTRGALAHHDIAEPLIRCRYYDSNQACYSGEHCNYVHVLFIDPDVRRFYKRVPKAHVEITDAVNPSSHKHQLQSRHHEHNGQKKQQEENVSISDAADGKSDIQSTNIKWVPNVNSSSFVPSKLSPFAFLPGFNQTISLNPAVVAAPQETSNWNMTGLDVTTQPMPQNGRLHSIPTLNYSDSLDCHVQDLLKGFPLPNESGNATPSLKDEQSTKRAERSKSSDVSGLVTQEQLNNALSSIFCLLAQQAPSLRTVGVKSSPLLDDPRSIGTLLFLPRGATEAIPVQNIYDHSLLNTVSNLVAQNDRQ